MHGTCANNNPSRSRPCPDRLKKVLCAGSPGGSGFVPTRVSRRGSDSRSAHLSRSANGRISVPTFRAAHELHRNSADNKSDSSLLLKTQTTICED
jgi:hypothetical protein